AGTPAEVVDKLNAAAKKALADPAVAARMADFSAKIVASTPEELKTHVSAEIAKWEPVVKAANVQMD
ncbi:tripartite tricarboxylate transporter substrate-binding protein, partial [Staphylococcus aureus]